MLHHRGGKNVTCPERHVGLLLVHRCVLPTHSRRPILSYAVPVYKVIVSLLFSALGSKIAEVHA